ncbi:hypothetical protein EDB81DRAFT_767551 [Dactylonectria macrodidyma]|uniref:Uncharacterized protein n=1 Tax=Dactylonectria macrodidyma TaxID=307937 RepID=A0A9P9IDM0_9HYPO|nr:hypothetical protein EDB81DRAFT_767551 [Dactylonectria macrodidyma]
MKATIVLIHIFAGAAAAMVAKDPKLMGRIRVNTVGKSPFRFWQEPGNSKLIQFTALASCKWHPMIDEESECWRHADVAGDSRDVLYRNNFGFGNGAYVVA